MVTSIRRSCVIATLALLAGTAAAQTVVRGPIQRPNDPSRYYVVQGANWTQMRDFARSMGGDLATINDAAENTFVGSTVMNAGEKAFIGLNDAATEGTLVWSDGSTATYRNFAPGVSNDAPSDYTLINSGSGVWDIEGATFTPFAIVEITGPVRLPGERTTLVDAIVAASIGPKVLILGPGDFTTPSVGVIINTDITIRGSGVGVTRLQGLVGSTNTINLTANVVIEDMTLDQRASNPLFDFDLASKQLTIRNCEVTSSVGLDSGELVRLENSTVTFDSTLIHNIDAAVEGAAGQNQARFINCVIRDVDIITRREAAVNIVNTFVNCTITRVTGALATDVPSNTFYNTVVFGEPNPYTAAQRINTVFTNTNPGFVNPAANNFNLLPTSSLIDAGSTAGFLRLAPSDFTDFAGNPRGVDIAAITNTGNGALALDIGAYEFQNQIGCDDIDFNNNNVFPEDQDVIDFFTVLAGGECQQ